LSSLDRLRRMSMSRIDQSDEPSHTEAQEGNILLYDLLVQEGRVIGADRGFKDVDVVLRNCLSLSSGFTMKLSFRYSPSA
jgi:hypothetical protein